MFGLTGEVLSFLHPKSDCGREYKNRTGSHKRKDYRFDGQGQPVICCGDRFRHSSKTYVGKTVPGTAKKLNIPLRVVSSRE